MNVAVYVLHIDKHVLNQIKNKKKQSAIKILLLRIPVNRQPGHNHSRMSETSEFHRMSHHGGWDSTEVTN